MNFRVYLGVVYAVSFRYVEGSFEVGLGISSGFFKVALRVYLFGF